MGHYDDYYDYEERKHQKIIQRDILLELPKIEEAFKTIKKFMNDYRSLQPLVDSSVRQLEADIDHFLREEGVLEINSSIILEKLKDNNVK